jgi:peroxin-3
MLGITRSLVTIYLLPLLLLLTQSQLTLLARIHYLRTVRESLPAPPMQARKSGWLSYLSVEGMGLSEFAESSSSYLPFGLGSMLAPSRTTDKLQQEEDAEPAIDQETERLFLCFSWWLLNEGWKGVADRVEAAVRDEFAS